MHKIIYILMCSLLPSVIWGQLTQSITPTWSKPMVESRGESAMKGHDENPTRYANSNWDYVGGLVAKSLLKYYQQYKDAAEYAESAEQAYALAKGYADKSVSSNASSPTPNGFVNGSIDAIAASKILIDLHEREKDSKGNSKYKTAAEWVTNYLLTDYPKITQELGKGGFYHKKGYPNQMWLDGLYMGAAFLAEYLNAFNPANEADVWKTIALQFKTIHAHTWDAEKHLNYHAWAAAIDDNAFWAKEQWNEDHTEKTTLSIKEGHSQEFWGRGMGWYFAALVDVLEFMPEGDDREALMNILQDVASGLKARQDEHKGVWCQLLQYPEGTEFMKGKYESSKAAGTNISKDTKQNYFEASASCMFTYSYLKACRLGLLDKSTYEPVARKAFKGVQEVFITKGTDGKPSLGKICRSAGLGASGNKYRDGTPQYYLWGKDATEIATNEGKGVGPYIMACLEYERLMVEDEKASSIFSFDQKPEAMQPTLTTFNLKGEKVDDDYKGIVISKGKKIIKK